MEQRFAKCRSSDSVEPCTMLWVIWRNCSKIDPLHIFQMISLGQVKRGRMFWIQLEVTMRGFQLFVMFSLNHNRVSINRSANSLMPCSAIYFHVEKSYISNISFERQRASNLTRKQASKLSKLAHKDLTDAHAPLPTTLPKLEIQHLPQATSPELCFWEPRRIVLGTSMYLNMQPSKFIPKARCLRPN